MKLSFWLCVANQQRNCGSSNFFSYENTSVPPSLSKDGKVWSGDKVDLLDSLYNRCNTQDAKPTVDGIVVEGPVLVTMYGPAGQRTFKEYFEERLEPFLHEKLVHVNRLDVVWDIYLVNNLKVTTHQKGGDVSRKKVTGSTIMPRRWDTFLRNSQNKASLIQLISNCIKSELFPGLNQKKMVRTYNEYGIYSSDGTEPATLLPCNHKKVDYRDLLYSENMSKEGVNQTMILLWIPML